MDSIESNFPFTQHLPQLPSIMEDNGGAVIRQRYVGNQYRPRVYLLDIDVSVGV